MNSYEYYGHIQSHGKSGTTPKFPTLTLAQDHPLILPRGEKLPEPDALYMMKDRKYTRPVQWLKTSKEIPTNATFQSTNYEIEGACNDNC